MGRGPKEVTVSLSSLLNCGFKPNVRVVILRGEVGTIKASMDGGFGVLVTKGVFTS